MSSNTVTVTLLASTDYLGPGKKNELNYYVDQMDATNIYKTFHPVAAEYTFFSPARIFSRIDHVLGRKISLNKLKKKSYHVSSDNEYRNQKPTTEETVVNIEIHGNYASE